ncbi:MAG: type VI secretion system baseplate subunit TssE [Planctomycetia bacterium]|nr:type VI secretion system baseplate subunit TssE [Planctomycetia bacterium]
MSRLNVGQRLLPSMLDRLTDPDSGGTAAGQGYSMQQVIEAVRRDLEELLNTRQTSVGIPTIYEEIHNSIVAYGLPDMTAINAATPGERANIGRTIEKIVAKYEPRLKDVRANLVESAKRPDRLVRFEIHARLDMDPSPEVGFQTVLELMTGQTSIKRADL